MNGGGITAAGLLVLLLALIGLAVGLYYAYICLRARPVRPRQHIDCEDGPLIPIDPDVNGNHEDVAVEATAPVDDDSRPHDKGKTVPCDGPGDGTPNGLVKEKEEILVPIEEKPEPAKLIHENETVTVVNHVAPLGFVVPVSQIPQEVPPSHHHSTKTVESAKQERAEPEVNGPIKSPVPVFVPVPVIVKKSVTDSDEEDGLLLQKCAPHDDSLDPDSCPELSASPHQEVPVNEVLTSTISREEKDDPVEGSEVPQSYTEIIPDKPEIRELKQEPESIHCELSPESTQHFTVSKVPEPISIVAPAPDYGWNREEIPVKKSADPAPNEVLKENQPLLMKEEVENLQPVKEMSDPTAISEDIQPVKEVSDPVTINKDIQPVTEVSDHVAISEDLQPIKEVSDPVTISKDIQPVKEVSDPVTISKNIQPVKEVSDPVAISEDLQPINEVSDPVTISKDAQLVKEVSDPVAISEDLQPVKEVSDPVNISKDIQPVKEVSDPVAVSEDLQPVKEVSDPVIIDIHPVKEISDPVVISEDLQPVREVSDPLAVSQDIEPFKEVSDPVAINEGTQLVREVSDTVAISEDLQPVKEISDTVATSEYLQPDPVAIKEVPEGTADEVEQNLKLDSDDLGIAEDQLIKEPEVKEYPEVVYLETSRPYPNEKEAEYSGSSDKDLFSQSKPNIPIATQCPEETNASMVKENDMPDDNPPELVVQELTSYSAPQMASDGSVAIPVEVDSDGSSEVSVDEPSDDNVEIPSYVEIPTMLVTPIGVQESEPEPLVSSSEPMTNSALPKEAAIVPLEPVNKPHEVPPNVPLEAEGSYYSDSEDEGSTLAVIKEEGSLDTESEGTDTDTSEPEVTQYTFSSEPSEPSTENVIADEISNALEPEVTKYSVISELEASESSDNDSQSSEDEVNEANTALLPGAENAMGNTVVKEGSTPDKPDTEAVDADKRPSEPSDLTKFPISPRVESSIEGSETESEEESEAEVKEELITVPVIIQNQPAITASPTVVSVASPPPVANETQAPIVCETDSVQSCKGQIPQVTIVSVPDSTDTLSSNSSLSSSASDLSDDEVTSSNHKKSKIPRLVERQGS